MRTVARVVLSLLTLLPLIALGKEPAAGATSEEGLPLETTREIEFDTDEATWLSLDVSPDGLTLVLELLGDLYRLPIGGGEANRLTEGPAFDSQPRFSPDGDWIAFLSDRDGAENVWIARKDGSEPKKLSQDKQAEFASPAWTPDGEYVIVSRSSWGLGTYELWMYHVLGGSGVQITRAKGSPQVPRGGRHNALGVVASPDERFLYYARRTGGFSYNATFPMWQIARRDRVTGIEDVLTQAPGSAIRPLLSPDGTRLVYGTRRDAETGLRIRDLATGEDRWLAYPVQRDDQESRFTRDLLPGYAFASDGQEIVLASGGRIERIDVDTGARTVVPFTAKISQRLGPRLDFPHRVEEGTVWARLIQSPVASPDGKRLAFSALTRLYVKPLEDGARPKRIAEAAYQPTWSPDGRWLAYVTWTIDGGHLWKTRADGSGRPVRLSERSAFYSDPVWSPDGSRIVALRASTHSRVTRPVEFGGGPGLDLIWLPADGGEARLVIPARGVGGPHFTRDPERIYLYLSDGTFGGSGDHGLVSMRYDGSDRRTHLKVTGPGLYFAEEPVSASEIRMRPDGQWALAHVSNQLYLVAVPPFSNETPTVNIGSPTVPLKKLTDVGADYFGWADDGSTLTWAIGASFFRRAFDSVSFEPPPATDDDDDKKKGDDASEERQAEEAKADEHIVTIELPRHTPRGTVVLRGATAITMRGDEVIPNADVVVQDNRILAVGARGRVEIPPTAQEIDVTGRTIVPGFVDTHAHWFEIRRGVLDTQNWSFLANLAYGVTAGLDVQTSTNDMFAYQDLVDVGAILGPRAYSTGPGIFSNNAFETVEQAKGVLRRYRDYYRTRNLKSYIVGNRRQRQLVAQAAYELQMMPTTEGALDLKLDLTHVLDGFSGNEHALPIVPLYRDVVELVARSGIGYTPTLLVSYGGPWAENHFYTTEDVHEDPKLNRFTPHEIIDQKSLRRPWFHADEHIYPQLAAEAAKIIRAGGRVGVGAHGQLQGLGYHWELWALASGGLTPLEALRAATLHGAQIIGYGEDLGSLEPGKLADLVILEADPRDDIRNTNAIDMVMKNGELFDADTLNQIWPEKKPLPPLWWWDEQP